MDLVQTVRKEGSRGGRAEFKWEDVKQDSQRENYLGHSLMAPVGRWQQGRDLNWYAKGDAEAESQQSAAEKLAEERRKVKEAEEDAMLKAMGLPVPDRASTNANLTPLGKKAHEADMKHAMEEKAKEGDEEERRKDRKDRSRRERRDRDDDDRSERRRRHRSRSRSRDRDRRDRRRERSRSRERRRDRDHDRHRHRSRSREHRRRDDHYERRREHYPDDERERSRSRERHRRRRSRSPRDKHERRRD